jgi:hypothetical protein
LPPTSNLKEAAKLERESRRRLTAHRPLPYTLADNGRTLTEWGQSPAPRPRRRTAYLQMSKASVRVIGSSSSRSAGRPVSRALRNGAGYHNRLVVGLTPGYGAMAVLIALLGKSAPAGVAVASAGGVLMAGAGWSRA